MLCKTHSTGVHETFVPYATTCRLMIHVHLDGLIRHKSVINLLF